MKNTELLLARLKKVAWMSRSEASGEDEDKIYEFLKQAARIISTHARQQGVHPFSNFRHAINRNAPLVSTLEVEEIVNIDNGVGAYEKVLCMSAFHWANGCDESDEVCLSVSDLYEPIISVIEKRVFFNLRRGELCIGKSSFPLRDWLVTYYTA
ncbi:hypothetical protein PSGK_27505 [Pseudomonas solani]|uniref:hypothetical protein n=1 Tax=Pseudomonas solani TaxID=2731552 RepID=UPI0035BE4DFB